MELKKIRVQKFKKINDVKLELSPVNLIIGGNNAGKSSVLQAIHTSVSAVQTQAEQGNLKAFAEETLRYSPASDFSSLGYKSPFGNRSDQNRATISFSADELVQTEAGEELKQRDYSIELYKGRNPKVVGVERRGNPRFGSTISSLDKPFSIYVPGLAGVQHHEELKAIPVVLRKIAGGEANLVLRNVIWQIKEQGKLDTLISKLKIIFPSIHIRTNFDPLRDTNIIIEVRPPKEVIYCSLELCGTGILQAIQILAYVELFQPKLLLLDEPDSHLHPSNQVKLIELLKYISEEYDTISIIATHSRHLMTAAQSIARFFWLDNGNIKPHGEFELAQVLMDIGGLDEADLILNSEKEFLIFTEDENKNKLKTLLQSCGIIPARFDVISYNGTSNSSATAKIIGSLKPFLKGDRKLIVHRDRDFHQDNELLPFREAFENLDFSVFITEGSDIESYFLNTEHLSSKFGKEIDEINELLSECIQTNEAKIRKRFKDKRQQINKSSFYNDGGAPLTSDLMPEDQAPELRHVVGKDFCPMLINCAREKWGIHINPVSRSDTILAPDLVAIFED